MNKATTASPLRRKFERRIFHRYGVTASIAGVIYDLQQTKAR